MELILNLPTTCIQILRKSILKIKFGKLVGYSTFLVPNPCPSREMGDIIKYKSSVLHRQCRNTRRNIRGWCTTEIWATRFTVLGEGSRQTVKCDVTP